MYINQVQGRTCLLAVEDLLSKHEQAGTLKPTLQAKEMPDSYTPQDRSQWDLLWGS